MKWHTVLRNNQYLSVRRRIAPSSQEGPHHEELYLGSTDVVGLPKDVITTAFNVYFPVDKPEPHVAHTVLQKLKQKRTGVRPVPVKVSILK